MTWLRKEKVSDNMEKRVKEQSSHIFTIERRMDFSETFTKFFEDLQSLVQTSTGSNLKMFDYLNYCIRYWPYRCSATGVDDYLKGIGIDITNPRNDKDLLLILELLINLLHWALKQDSVDSQNMVFDLALKKSDVENETGRLLENAEYLLEQSCNMRIREENNDNFPRYYITKRAQSQNLWDLGFRT